MRTASWRLARSLRRILLVGVLAGVAVAMWAPSASALPHSVNVAYVFDFGTGIGDTNGPGSGSSIFRNAITGSNPAGGLYTTSGGNLTHFTDMPVSTITGVASFAGFDTVLLYMVCDIKSHAALVTALNTYLINGLGKVVIYDGDRCASGPGLGGVPDYSTFQFPFTSTNPGPVGSLKTLTFVEVEAPPNTLTAGLAVGQGDGSMPPNDAVGDSNTFATNAGGWCAALKGTNAIGTVGIQEGYARTPAGGLAIYNGQDNWFTFGARPFQKQVFDDILDQPFSPDGLPCGVPVTGIKLAPATDTNVVGTNHTVTATVSDSDGHPQAGVVVTFSITSGPNSPKTGTGVTDASGNASFTYTGTGGVGTDHLVATFVDNLGAVHTSNEVTKNWIRDPDISATGGLTFTATEPGTVSGHVATFTDPETGATAAEYAATINWGDGSSSPGTISGGGGSFTVDGSHTYADEGNYTITVTITDVDNPSNTATVTDTATIADAPLTARALVLSGGTEGSGPASASFSFTDGNATATAADFTATIAWGDGTTSTGTVAGGGSSFTVTGSHQYAEEGSYTVTVTVVDDGGSTTSASGKLTVADAPLTAACSLAPFSGQSFSGSVATFTDANPNGSVADFSATIAWGDGSNSAGTVSGGPGTGPYGVSGSHTYSSTGPVTVVVTITDVGGSTVSTRCTVLVFGTVGGGNFVIGDKNAAVGTAVTFWGAQWWKLNGLSGGSAPASFKGFEESPVATCGAGWSADPGNSTPPPAGPLPAYMAVVVSSSIGKSGSAISGNTVHIVVVKTNSGYDANPGHAGTGTVVGQVC